MPDESDSPSTGWRGVYAAMGASTSAEGDAPASPSASGSTPAHAPASGSASGSASATAAGDANDAASARDRDCPTCGGPSRPVGRGRYRCPDHGPWRASASATG